MLAHKIIFEGFVVVVCSKNASPTWNDVKTALLDFDRAGLRRLSARGFAAGRRRRWRHEGCAASQCSTLFISFLFSREGQQLLVDKGHLRSFHPDIVEPADRVPLSRIKVLTTDPVEQEKTSEEIKAKYAEYFGT